MTPTMKIQPLTPLPSNTAHLRPKNIRQSCDTCAKSKVRCERPYPGKCKRCTAQGAHCNFSESLRGPRETKRPASTQFSPRPHAGFQRNYTTHQANFPHLSSPPAIFQPVSPPSSETSNHSFNTGTVQAETPTGPATPPEAFGHSNIFEFQAGPDFVETGYDGRTGYGGPITFPPDPIGGMPGLADPQSNDYWRLVHPMEPSMSNPEDMSGMFGAPGEQVPESLFEPWAQNSPSTSRRPSSQPANHHWQALAFSTLQALESDTGCCSALPPTSEPVFATSLSRSLDTVLKTNRSAIDNTLAILGCSCSSDTTSALLMSMIIMKIISWYHACLNCTSTGSDHILPAEISTPNAFASMSDLQGPMFSPPPTATESVFMAPITIGAYKLDAEHRSRMVAQLVLADLAKMSKVLDGFSRKYGRGMASPALDVKTQLHSTLEMFLRSQLKAIIRAAKGHLDKK